MHALTRHIPAMLLLAACCLPLAAHAQSQDWEKLNPMQREALAPLSSTWDSLPEKQQPSARYRTKNARRSKRWCANSKNVQPPAAFRQVSQPLNPTQEPVVQPQPQNHLRSERQSIVSASPRNIQLIAVALNTAGQSLSAPRLAKSLPAK